MWYNSSNKFPIRILSRMCAFYSGTFILVLFFIAVVVSFGSAGSIQVLFRFSFPWICSMSFHYSETCSVGKRYRVFHVIVLKNQVRGKCRMWKPRQKYLPRCRFSSRTKTDYAGKATPSRRNILAKFLSSAISFCIQMCGAEHNKRPLEADRDTSTKHSERRPSGFKIVMHNLIEILIVYQKIPNTSPREVDCYISSNFQDHYFSDNTCLCIQNSPPTCKPDSVPTLQLVRRQQSAFWYATYILSIPIQLSDTLYSSIKDGNLKASGRLVFQFFFCGDSRQQKFFQKA